MKYFVYNEYKVSNKLECEQCVDVRDTIMYGIMGDLSVQIKLLCMQGKNICFTLRLTLERR